MVTYPRTTITDKNDVIAVAKNAGSHFFDASAMRFFDSHILEGVKALDGEETAPGRRYLFRTSEQFQALSGPRQPREYRVRMLTLKEGENGRPAVDIKIVEAATRHTASASREALDLFATFPECRESRFGEPCRLPANVSVFRGDPEPVHMCGFCASMTT